MKNVFFITITMFLVLHCEHYYEEEEVKNPPEEEVEVVLFKKLFLFGGDGDGVEPFDPTNEEEIFYALTREGIRQIDFTKRTAQTELTRWLIQLKYITLQEYILEGRDFGLARPYIRAGIKKAIQDEIDELKLKKNLPDRDRKKVEFLKKL